MAKPVCRVLIPENLEQAFLFIVALLEALGLTPTKLAASECSRTRWPRIIDSDVALGG